MRLFRFLASRNSATHHSDARHAGDTRKITSSQRSAACFKAFCHLSPAFSPRSGSRSRNRSSQPWLMSQSRTAMASALFPLEWLKKIRAMGVVPPAKGPSTDMLVET